MIRRTDWNSVLRSVKKLKEGEVRLVPLAEPLADVFSQLEAMGVGGKASGYEYEPRRRALTTRERREAREILREQLKASVALLQGSKGSGSA